MRIATLLGGVDALVGTSLLLAVKVALDLGHGILVVQVRAEALLLTAALGVDTVCVEVALVFRAASLNGCLGNLRKQGTLRIRLRYIEGSLLLTGKFEELLLQTF